MHNRLKDLLFEHGSCAKVIIFHSASSKNAVAMSFQKKTPPMMYFLHFVKTNYSIAAFGLSICGYLSFRQIARWGHSVSSISFKFERKRKTCLFVQ